MQVIISAADLTAVELHAVATMEVESALHVIHYAYKVEQEFGQATVVKYADLVRMCLAWETTSMLKCYLQAMQGGATPESFEAFRAKVEDYMLARA